MRLRLFVLAFVTALLVPAIGHAQIQIKDLGCGPTDPKTGEAECSVKLEEHSTSRFVIDADYVGGGFGDIYSYPNQPTLRSGKTFDADGIAIDAEVRLTDVVSAGYRFEHLGLRHSQFVTESALTNGEVQRLAEPDPNASTGTLSYQEWFGSFKLPKTHGHALIVGLAKSKYEQEWHWREQGGIGTSKYGSSAVGLVIGGEGHQKIGKSLTVDYAGRFYPRLANTTGYEGTPSQFKSVGFELRSMATWTVAKHVGLTGGYQFRRMGTDIVTTGADGQPWPLYENQDANSKYFVGTRFSF